MVIEQVLSFTEIHVKARACLPRQPDDCAPPSAHFNANIDIVFETRQTITKETESAQEKKLNSTVHRSRGSRRKYGDERVDMQVDSQ